MIGINLGKIFHMQGHGASKPYVDTLVICTADLIS